MTPPIERRSGVDRRQGDRRRGRPRLLVEPSVLSVQVEADTHDRIIRAGARHAQSVSEITRGLLELGLTVDETYAGVFVSRNSEDAGKLPR